MEPHGLSSEQAKELRESPHWKLVVQELEYRIFCKVNELRRCKPEDLRLIQVALDCLEELKRLPDDVADRESDSDR